MGHSGAKSGSFPQQMTIKRNYQAIDFIIGGCCSVLKTDDSGSCGLYARGSSSLPFGIEIQ
jgi:hypothetical protein